MDGKRRVGIMKKLFVALLAVVLACGIALAVTVSVDDIIKLRQEGVSPEVIKTFIKSSGQKFELSADDILKLKKANVPEEIIQMMMNTSVAPETTAPQPVQVKAGELEIGYPYQARFHSVFSFQVFKKRKLADEKMLEVGKRDALKNTAARGGTLILTDSQIIMYDMDGDERIRVDYSTITGMEIETRYKDRTEQRHHPFDTFVLTIDFKKEGVAYSVKIYTMPKPDKVDKYYGDVFAIGKAIQEYGKAANPKLATPLKTN
jgi:hypothetical protein